MWTAIANKLKEIWKRMFSGTTIGNALNINIAPIISTEMEQSIILWDKMYKGKADWIHEPSGDDHTRVVSLGLPAMIASEKARMALIEFESEITVATEEKEVDNPDYVEPQPDEFGNVVPSMEPPKIKEDVPKTSDKRAVYLEQQYQKLKKKLRKQLEYGIAKGGLVIKPYVVLNNGDDVEYTADIEFDFIQADNFYPLAFDASGHITEAAFIQTKIDKSTVYRRLEYHKWEKNKVTVINKAFKTTNMDTSMDRVVSLGNECPLTEIPEWSGLQEKTIIKDVKQPLFAYFKMPEANTIDTTSPLGVSGYSRAVSLIKDADMQYSRLLWEYEAGEMAIDIDRDALKSQMGADGQYHETLNHMQERLYRKVDLSTTGDTFIPYAPTLRDQNYITGLNNILMRIEDVCSISRGTLSDVTAEAKTATEMKILKQRSFQANLDIQQSLEDTLREVIYIMDVYSDLYEITAPGEYDVNFEWDDSILVDINEEINKRITLMQQGLMSKLELRMWYFGETERQAQQALASADKEMMNDMENEMVMQSNFNNDEKGFDFNKNKASNKKEEKRDEA